MSTRESLITYQSYASSECLDRLIQTFGDTLESLTAVDKFELIAILGFWQACDTDAQLADMPGCRLHDYLGINSELQVKTSRQLDEALMVLADCTDEDALTLLVTLPCQLRDGIYQS
ncbi:MAG: hypothetical protein LH702_19145 [Phormidesmis sp. CAN_BIN44]|nr:hypothetical protein [Phormidesmis sp. CAN_BIN44]